MPNQHNPVKALSVDSAFDIEGAMLDLITTWAGRALSPHECSELVSGREVAIDGDVYSMGGVELSDHPSPESDPAAFPPGLTCKY